LHIVYPACDINSFNSHKIVNNRKIISQRRFVKNSHPYYIISDWKIHRTSTSCLYCHYPRADPEKNMYLVRNELKDICTVHKVASETAFKCKSLQICGNFCLEKYNFFETSESNCEKSYTKCLRKHRTSIPLIWISHCFDRQLFTSFCIQRRLDLIFR